MALTLGSIALSAFFLGFAHEEEFTLLSLVMGGINPVWLMICYAAAVTLGLMGITLISMLIYQRLQVQIHRYSAYFPRVSAIILLALALRLLLK